MAGIQIMSVQPEEKGRVRIRFENGTEIILYKGEIRSLQQQEGDRLLTAGNFISETLYQKILHEVAGLRAKKRAVFLLERMDRTRQQLKDKLKQNGYPEVCIEEAIAYMEKHHYLDDMRYARNYIRLHQEKKSRQKLKMDLMAKGIDREEVERALAEEYEADETAQIRKLLEKRHYVYGNNDRKEQQRVYQYLMRRGFCSSDILRIMQTEPEE